MRFSTNFSSSLSKTFEPVPAGKYDAEIFEATPEKSLNGKPFLNIDFTIIGPAYEGRHVWTKLFMTNAAVWKLAALFNAIDEPPTEEADTAALIGKKLLIVLKVTEGDDGILRNEVTSFRKFKAASV